MIKLSSEIEEATNFEDCVSNKISVIADEDPDVKPDQRAAIAYSMCRKKFGISKASILFLLEKSQLLNEESLEQVKATMEKGMESADWIEFAAFMKNEGCKHQEIVERVNKSESWIKKYVNPVLEEVTPPINLTNSSDTTNQLIPGLPIHTILKFTVTEIRKETRTFGGWGSVEVLDSQEEVVSIEGLEAIMPTYMKRGSPIMFGHSNRHVGNVFKYLIKDKLVKGEYIPALWLEGRIFSDYKIDDMAWEAIQYAYSAGLPVLSLGATPIGHPEVQCNDSACFKKYNEFQLYEFTVTEQQIGSIGANPEATMEVVLSKSKEGKELNESQKQAIGKHLVQLEKSSALPANDVDLVNMMLATCKSCQEEFQKLLKEGNTEDQAKASLLKDLVESMSTIQKEDVDKAVLWSPEFKQLTDRKKKLQRDIETTSKRLEGQKKKLNEVSSKLGKLSKADESNMPEPDKNEEEEEEEEKSTAISNGETDLAAALIKINDRLDIIEQSITKTTANVGETNAAFVPGSTIVKEGEAAQKASETTAADKAPAQLTFSKDFGKQMDSYLQQKGFQKVAETPVPATSEGREITKGTANVPANQSALPGDEEMREAMADWKNGGITKLAEKYGY